MNVWEIWWMMLLWASFDTNKTKAKEEKKVSGAVDALRLILYSDISSKMSIYK